MRVHFVGVGDIGMQQLALILRDRGDIVDGSDLVQGQVLPKTPGWFPEKLDSDLDLVVVGPTIGSGNPELQRAAALGTRICSKEEFIYELTRHSTRVVIAGNAGKAAVCALIIYIMDYHNKHVDYFLVTPNRNVEGLVRYSGTSDFVLIEDGMSESSILEEKTQKFVCRPNIALLIDLEWAPSQEYPTLGEFLNRTGRFVDDIVKGGSITYNGEDSRLVNLVEASENTIRKLPFGSAEHLKKNGEVFLITPEGAMPAFPFGDLKWVEGAKWICQHMGVDADDFYEALASFEGYPEDIGK